MLNLKWLLFNIVLDDLPQYILEESGIVECNFSQLIHKNIDVFVEERY